MIVPRCDLRFFPLPENTWAKVAHIFKKIFTDENSGETKNKKNYE